MRSTFRVVLLLLIMLHLVACATILPAFDTASPLGLPKGVQVAEHPVNIENSLTQVDWPIPIPEPMPTPILEVEEVTMALMPSQLYTDAEITCMATAIYREARGEPLAGMAAVGYVIKNRMEHGYFADSVCGVVYERNRGRCEFSWVCQGKGTPSAGRLEEMRMVALGVMSGEIPNPIGDSIFFRTLASHGQMPYERYVVTIGGHRFYASRRGA